MSQQPTQPTDNAISVNEITSSIVADLLPIGGNTIKALWMKEVERRFQLGQERLLDAVTKRGISALSAEQLSLYVPASYRFFEKVRLGLSEYSMSVLAGLIADGTCDVEHDLEIISRISDAVAGLEVIELQILFLAAKHQDRFPEEHDWPDKDRQPFISAELIKKYEKDIGVDEEIVDQALNDLRQRGLLLGTRTTFNDAICESYKVSPLGMLALGKVGFVS